MTASTACRLTASRPRANDAGVCCGNAHNFRVVSCRTVHTRTHAAMLAMYRECRLELCRTPQAATHTRLALSRIIQPLPASSTFSGHLRPPLIVASLVDRKVMSRLTEDGVRGREAERPLSLHRLYEPFPSQANKPRCSALEQLGLRHFQSSDFVRPQVVSNNPDRTDYQSSLATSWSLSQPTRYNNARTPSNGWRMCRSIVRNDDGLGLPVMLLSPERSTDISLWPEGATTTVRSRLSRPS
ncbi:hypothetical protein F4780DRAFT_694817 [Xylariomycetidae sp. FL0641]|nr:hypothetical protein F4780DRAFT_694817 [Xylariomycetidae sp. FL0641]